MGPARIPGSLSSTTVAVASSTTVAALAGRHAVDAHSVTTARGGRVLRPRSPPPAEGGRGGDVPFPASAVLARY
jgi:hypothetical protein